MSISPASSSLFASHTFGRGHAEPPPLPASVQPTQAISAIPIDGASAQAAPIHAVSGLPQDFDHIVRGIGEW